MPGMKRKAIELIDLTVDENKPIFTAMIVNVHEDENEVENHFFHPHNNVSEDVSYDDERFLIPKLSDRYLFIEKQMFLKRSCKGNIN